MHRPTPSHKEQEQAALQRRLFELGIAVIGLVVFGPLLALVAALIKLESPGPVFFVQRRVGKGGKTFPMIKFRSMREARSGEIEEHDIDDIESFTYRPPAARMTLIGRVLRACSLDEMANLLNVIRGDMHLVGPRPEESELVEKYLPEYHRRHDVKPGITGLAQIHGRADLTYRETMAYDLAYVDHHPFSRDIRILLKTLGVVIRREGAR